MGGSREFVDYVMEQMSFVVRGLHVRAMFGGYGIYQNNRIFAIIVNDALYLKSDATVQRDFEEKGLLPFTYVAQGKSVVMQYFEAPPEVFEESESMRVWAEKALGAAIRQRSRSPTPNPSFERDAPKAARPSTLR